MIFAYFLGMCSFLAVSKNVKTAFGLGIAVTFMLVVTLPINYLLNTYVLQPGALSWLGEDYASVDLSFLGLIMFIAVIASMTQLVEMAVEKFSPSLYASLGIFLPLIAVNCAILGCSLFMQERGYSSIGEAFRQSPRWSTEQARALAGCSPLWASLPYAKKYNIQMFLPPSKALALHSSSQVLWVSHS